MSVKVRVRVGKSVKNSNDKNFKLEILVQKTHAKLRINMQKFAKIMQKFAKCCKNAQEHNNIVQNCAKVRNIVQKTIG